MADHSLIVEVIPPPRGLCSPAALDVTQTSRQSIFSRFSAIIADGQTVVL